MALDLAPQLRRLAPATRTATTSDRNVDPLYQQTRQRRLAALLVVLVVVSTVLFVLRPDQVLSAPLVPIVVAAGLFLHAMPMYVVFAAAGASLLITSVSESAPTVTVAAVVVVMMLMVAVERRRTRTGITAEAGVEMIVDLRERIADQSRLSEPLPQGWHLDSSIQAAHGAALSGDFVITQCTADSLALVLVDVEGKGMQCGARSLMLSGAFSGLLGTTGPADFLPAANRYLLRQGWRDGCATAIHLALDLRTGEYTLRSAGHPAAIQYRAGAGRWEERAEARGVMLGVIDSELVTYHCATGRIERGDALLLYSDGVIESPDCDLQQGMDRMLGAADRVVTGQAHAGGAALICDIARAGETDDRSAVLLRRD